MGLAYRTIRAAGAAVLIAAAVGAGGMTGMTSALAVDPATVALTGVVHDDSGAPFADIELVITEELADDGGLAAFHATTGSDGAFSVDVYAWGTAAAPASLSIKSADDILRVGDTCTQTWGVATSVQLALAEAPSDSLRIAASLLGEVCGTTGTPGDDDGGSGTDQGGSGTGSDNSAGGNSGGSGVRLTPPPTDVSLTVASAGSDRLGPALTIGFIVGMLIAATFLMPGPRARRRS